MTGNVGFRIFGTNKINIWDLNILPYIQKPLKKSIRKEELCMKDQSKNIVEMLCKMMNYKCRDKVD